MKEAAQVGRGWKTSELHKHLCASRSASLPGLAVVAMLLVSGCARPAAKEEAKPVTWEYKTMEVKRTSHTYGALVLPEREMNELGARGWELVGGMPEVQESTKEVKLVFKREAGKYPEDHSRWDPDARSFVRN